jgi:hypothetical protein
LQENGRVKYEKNKVMRSAADEIVDGESPERQKGVTITVPTTGSVQTLSRSRPANNTNPLRKRGTNHGKRGNLGGWSFSNGITQAKLVYMHEDGKKLYTHSHLL